MLFKLLILTTQGPKSHEKLKTVKDVSYSSFYTDCEAKKLMVDNDIHDFSTNEITSHLIHVIAIQNRFLRLFLHLHFETSIEFYIKCFDHLL